VSPADPAMEAVTADLASARFRAGAMRSQWRQVSYEFPILLLAVAAIEPDGSSSEYCFRFELTGFPGTAPEVIIWDPVTQALLPADKRPKGSPRVSKAFQVWQDPTVYRPWDRRSGTHNNFTRDHPDLAWHPKRDLTFILEDLHGLLTSNATAHGNRPAA
jgi:hypothetical protein